MRTDFTGPNAETVADCALVASKVFEAMDWRWGWSEPNTPDAEIIAATFTHLLKNVDEADPRITAPESSTGRLMVQRRGGRTRFYVEVGSFYDDPNPTERPLGALCPESSPAPSEGEHLGAATG